MLEKILAMIPSPAIDYFWFVLWVISFIFALILVFPPSRLRHWRRYCISLFVYVLMLVVFIIITMEIIRREATIDDSVGLMLLPSMMATPSILMLLLLGLRALFWFTRTLFRYFVGNRNAQSS